MASTSPIARPIKRLVAKVSKRTPRITIPRCVGSRRFCQAFVAFESARAANSTAIVVRNGPRPRCSLIETLLGGLHHHKTTQLGKPRHGPPDPTGSPSNSSARRTQPTRIRRTAGASDRRLVGANFNKDGTALYEAMAALDGEVGSSRAMSAAALHDSR